MLKKKMLIILAVIVVIVSLTFVVYQHCTRELMPEDLIKIARKELVKQGGWHEDFTHTYEVRGPYEDDMPGPYEGETVWCVVIRRSSEKPGFVALGVSHYFIVIDDKTRKVVSFIGT